MFQNTHFEIVRLLLIFFLLGIGIAITHEGNRIIRLILFPTESVQKIDRWISFIGYFLSDLLFAGFTALTLIIAGYLMNKGRIRSDMLIVFCMGFLLFHGIISTRILCHEKRLANACKNAARFIWLHSFVAIWRELIFPAAKKVVQIIYRIFTRKEHKNVDRK